MLSDAFDVWQQSLQLQLKLELRLEEHLHQLARNGTQVPGGLVAEVEQRRFETERLLRRALAMAGPSKPINSDPDST